MIKLSQIEKPIVRECTAPFIHPDESGELKTHQIRVRYRSVTSRDLKAQRADMFARHEANPNGIVYLSETLAKRIESLPDLIGEDGEPVQISEDFLDTLAVENLQAINQAINEGTDGKSRKAGDGAAQ